MSAALTKLTRPKTTNELAVDLGVSYATAQHILKKLVLKQEAVRIKALVKKVKIKYIINKEFKKAEDSIVDIDLAEAKQKIISELLPVWQPLAAIALRCNMSYNTASRILNKMHESGIVQKSNFRMGYKCNKADCYKKVEQVKILGVFMPLEQSEYV